MNEKVFLLTDGCMWEINKEAGNEHPHGVEVVDLETGAVRYIKSGFHIALVKGEITDIRTQKKFNKTTIKALSGNRKDLQQRTDSKKKSAKKV
mgnify:CR=1 FL=1